MQPNKSFFATPFFRALESYLKNDASYHRLFQNILAKTPLEENKIALAKLSRAPQLELLLLLGFLSYTEGLTLSPLAKKLDRNETQKNNELLNERLSIITRQFKEKKKKEEDDAGTSLIYQSQNENTELNIPSWPNRIASVKEILDFAESENYIFSVTPEQLIFVERFQKSLSLLELINFNVENNKLHSENGIAYANWCNINSYEETEAHILKSLLLLSYDFEEDTTTKKEFKAIVSNLVALRIQAHTDSLFSLVNMQELPPNQQFFITCAQNFFSDLFDTPTIEASDKPFTTLEKRQILLVNAILTMQDYIKEVVQAEEWQNYLQSTIITATTPFLHTHTPLLSRISEFLLAPQIIQETAFFPHTSTNSTAEKQVVVQKDTSQDKETPLFLTNEQNIPFAEELFKVTVNHIRTRPNGQEILQNMNTVQPTPLKYLHLLSSLPDAYLYYALGVLSYSEARQLSILSEKILVENIDATFKTIQSTLSEEEQNSFLELRNNEETAPVELLDALSDFGVNEEDLIDQHPSFDTSLSILFNNYFDEFEPLLKRFKPQTFTFADTLKRLTNIILQSSQNIERQDSLGFVLIQDTKESNDPQEITLSRLEFLQKAISFSLTQPSSAQNIKQMVTIFNQLKKCNHYLLSKVFHDTLRLYKDFEDSTLKNRIKNILVAYQTYLLPALQIQSSDDKIKDNSSFQKEFMALIDTTRLVFLSKFTTKETYNFYKNWFDGSMNFSQKEKALLTKLPKLKTTPQKPLSQNEVIDFKENLKNKYLTSTELASPYNDKSIYSLAQDSEILFLMGAISQLELQACLNIIENTDDPEQSSDIEDLQAELEDSDIPLDMEINNFTLDALSAIRTAGSIYNKLDNYNQPANFLNFENDKSHVQNSFKENGAFLTEGYMILDLIVVIKSFKEENFETYIPIFEKLANSYWGGACQYLDNAINNMKNADKKAQMRHNRRLFNTQPPTSVQERLPIYESLFQDITKIYLYHFEGKPHKRTRELQKFSESFSLFYDTMQKTASKTQDPLKITNQPSIPIQIALNQQQQEQFKKKE